MTTSVINSDNGLVSGTSGIKTTGGDDGALNIQTNGSTVIAVGSDQSVSLSGATSISTSSSSAALRITQTGAGNALLVEDSSNPDSTPFVVNANGQVFVGTTTSDSTQYVTNPQVQIAGTGVASGTLLQTVWSASASANPALLLSKSKGTSVGTHGVVASSDILGAVIFSGDDGTNFIRSAQIRADVDGTPGTNDMPGRLVFSTTADGASTPTERLRITSAGAFGLSGANYGTSGQVLTSAGSGSAPTWSDAPAPTAGKLLGSADINSSSGVATISWSTTGIKRISVFMAGLGANNSGDTNIRVGHTTSVVTTSNYYTTNSYIQGSSAGTYTPGTADKWQLTSISGTNWPKNAVAEIALGSDGRPYMQGQEVYIDGATFYFYAGKFTTTWTTPQFQSVQVSLSGSSTYSGRVTVVGYTE